MRPKMQRFLHYFGWTAGLSFVAAFCCGLGMLTVIVAMIFFGDNSHLKKTTILAKINEETTIYMLDEQTPIGSFFSAGHRRYVPIDEVPAHMINAIIASEDQNFRNHIGVDPVAIASAGFSFLKTGRLRGASSITQQTVKNILDDWEFSLRRKFREAIASFQLERIYDKDQILEFYLNQFYVSGNGNGIGIAARYYFNKDVRDLDLVESAFIAGSVKGPSAYDPFIKFNKKSRENAIERAFHRKNYVLRRMFEQKWISEEEYLEAKEKPVKFQRGRFRTTEVALVHLIRQQLDRREILDALHLENVSQLSQAGLKIYTTIDKDMQEGAQLAMRRNLSRLETILTGWEPENPDRYRKLRELRENEFYYGKIKEIKRGKDAGIVVDFGLPEGYINKNSLMRYAKWLDLPYGRGWQKRLTELLDGMKVGDVIYVECREYDPESHQGVVDLQRRPKVNGGMIAVDKGEVRAVVSGFDTKGFNRAMTAKRQPGSVFKPLVFLAGMQLGWSVLDRLDNQRQIFPFQGQFYYPRGDHVSPYKETSMLWAGVVSENLASVYLAKHLLAKLNFDQFKQLLAFMELTPNDGESDRDFHYRIARATGVQLTNDGIKEQQLQNAISDLLLDVQYTTTEVFQSKLKKMWYGRGYLPEMQAVYALEPEEYSASRRAFRLNLLTNNFLRLMEVDKVLQEDWKAVQAKVDELGADAAFNDPTIQHVLKRFQKVSSNNRPALGYFYESEDELAQIELADADKLDQAQKEILRIEERSPVALTAFDLQSIWGGDAFMGSAGILMDDVKIDGWISHFHMAALGRYTDERYEGVISRKEPYDLHRYYQHHDFRVALGLEYAVKLAKAMGVESNIDPILSYPLGTNEVTVAEVAKIYQTFISGKVYRFYQEGPDNQLNFIRRIEDRYGKTIYEPEPQISQLFSFDYALQVREILRRIVTHGTGRKARGELFVGVHGSDESETTSEKDKKTTNIRVPAFGKTGTTNDYTNAYFAGFLPYPTVKNAPLDPDNAYVLSTYVGYDLNQMMRAGYLRVSGAHGALPAWIGLGKEIIQKKDYDTFIDTLDLNILANKEWPLKFGTRSIPLLIDMPRGVILGEHSRDLENYNQTNIDETGEDFVNEYLANIVKATVRLPSNESGGVLRKFHPFHRISSEDSSEFVPSEIDQAQDGDAFMKTKIGQSGGTLNRGSGNAGSGFEQGAGEKEDALEIAPKPADEGKQTQDSKPSHVTKKDRLFSQPPTNPNASPEVPQPSIEQEQTEGDDDFIEEELW